MRVSAARQGHGQDDAKVAFKDSQVALLVGARPRGPGMERKDLLLANAQIFSAQGKAMNEVADRNIKVLVVGNPANTNALIARANAKDLNPRNFTAMTRLDPQPRAVAAGRKDRQPHHRHPQAHHLGQPFLHAVSGSLACHRGGKAAKSLVDQAWIEATFIPQCSSAVPRSSSSVVRHQRLPRLPQPSIMCTPG